MIPPPIDYHALNAAGVLLHTFSHEDLARRWASRNAHKHAGLRIERVAPAERAVVFRPRPALRVVANA